jgi:hypothetical protein
VSWIAIAAVAVVIAAAAAFFAGRALAGGGPATLSEAVEQAQAGNLPCGETAAGDPGQGGPPDSGFIVRAVCAQDGAQAPRGAGGGRGPGGLTMQVKSVEGSTLTVTGPQGDTTIELGPDTTISRTTAGESADLKAGQNVIVGGGRQGEPASSVVIVPGD